MCTKSLLTFTDVREFFQVFVLSTVSAVTLMEKKYLELL